MEEEKVRMIVTLEVIVKAPPIRMENEDDDDYFERVENWFYIEMDEALLERESKLISIKRSKGKFNFAQDLNKIFTFMNEKP